MTHLGAKRSFMFLTGSFARVMASRLAQPGALVAPKANREEAPRGRGRTRGVMGDESELSASMSVRGARTLLGSVLVRRYAIGAVIGDGGACAVVEAEDLRTGRRVAIKIPHDAADPRTRREIRAARINHPNVCAIVDVHLDDDLAFLVMERLVGETLFDRIITTGPLAVPDVLDVFIQLLGALDAAHEAGIVHADVKPANLFLVARHGCAPIVKLLDFGSARPTTVLDPQVDLHAVGLTMFEALAGRPPFQTTSGTFELPDICRIRPDVPLALGRVLAWATGSTADGRFVSARRMQESLERVRAQHTTEAVAHDAMADITRVDRRSGMRPRAIIESPDDTVPLPAFVVSDPRAPKR